MRPEDRVRRERVNVGNLRPEDRVRCERMKSATCALRPRSARAHDRAPAPGTAVNVPPSAVPWARRRSRSAAGAAACRSSSRSSAPERLRGTPGVTAVTASWSGVTEHPRTPRAVPIDASDLTALRPIGTCRNRNRNTVALAVPKLQQEFRTLGDAPSRPAPCSAAPRCPGRRVRRRCRERWGSLRHHSTTLQVATATPPPLCWPPP
jgi:hypothetical protein